MIMILVYSVCLRLLETISIMHIMDYSNEDIRIFAIQETWFQRYLRTLLKPNKLNTLCFSPK